MSCFSISMYTMMIYTHLDNVLFLYFYVHHDLIHTWRMSCFSISMYTMMIYTHLDALFLYFYVHHDDLYTPEQCPVSLFLCTPWFYTHLDDVLFLYFYVHHDDLLVSNLKQNSMARRHALFSWRHALFPSAMPFFSAPCVQNVPFLTQMLSRRMRRYWVDSDAICFGAWYSQSGASPRRIPITLYAAVKSAISDFIDWRKPFDQRGSERFGDHTWPGRTLPWPTFKPTISVYTKVYISILYLWSKRLLINTQDIYWDTYEKFIFKVPNMINEVFFIFTTWCSDIFPTSLFTVRNIIWIWRLVL